MNDVVVWSGGADSTLVLARVLQQKQSAVTLTFTKHSQLNQMQLDMERIARDRFDKFAKSRSWNIQRYDIEVTTDAGVAGSGQAMVWFPLACSYVAEGDTLHFGYIQGDDFWHFKHEYTAVFQAICAASELTAKLMFDLEWHTKEDVMRELLDLGVPAEAYSTCDRPGLVLVGESYVVS